MRGHEYDWEKSTWERWIGRSMIVVLCAFCWFFIAPIYVGVKAQHRLTARAKRRVKELEKAERILKEHDRERLLEIAN